MNCNETRRWLDAHLDGELDLALDAEVSAHLRTCPACGVLVKSQSAWKATVAEKLPRFAPPPHLATRIRAELRAAGSGAPVAESRPARRHEWRGWLGALAGVAAALAVGFGWGQRHEGAQRLGQDLVTSHVIALTSGHMTDVASSDRHTVKPWLAEHIDFSPPVVDPAAAGFPLDGARVERVGGHLAAALIYHRAKHVVTVFVWPEGQAPLPQLESERGYHARSWSQGGFNWVALSDVAFSDLDQFVGLVREGAPR